MNQDPKLRPLTEQDVQAAVDERRIPNIFDLDLALVADGNHEDPDEHWANGRVSFRCDCCGDQWPCLTRRAIDLIYAKDSATGLTLLHFVRHPPR